MFHLALKMLMGDRAKYIMLVGGLTFATLLMTQQNAVFQGLLSWTTSHLRNIRAAIWVVEAHVESANETKPLRDTDVNRVRSVTGVDFAVPLFEGILRAKTASGADKQVMLIGLHGATLFGRPPQMLAGDLALLRLPNTVVIDELGVQRLSQGRSRPKQERFWSRGEAGGHFPGQRRQFPATLPRRIRCLPRQLRTENPRVGGSIPSLGT